MYEQAAIPIADPKNFGAVREVVMSSFSPSRIGDFLKAVERASLRVRDFEAVLAKGLFGTGTEAEYASLGNSDQGQIREFYLARLEQVAPELRQKFFNLYAYY